VELSSDLRYERRFGSWCTSADSGHNAELIGTIGVAGDCSVDNRQGKCTMLNSQWAGLGKFGLTTTTDLTSTTTALSPHTPHQSESDYFISLHAPSIESRLKVIIARFLDSESASASTF
jgi:hypothetical protein